MWCPEKRECMTLAYHYSQILARLIVLPASSAELERTFSITNHIKTLLCKRLNMKTLDCLIKITCKMNGPDIGDWDPTPADCKWQSWVKRRIQGLHPVSSKHIPQEENDDTDSD